MKNIFLILFFSCCLFGCKEETSDEKVRRYTRNMVYFKDNSDPNHPLCFARFVDLAYGPITNVPCEAVEYRLINGARKQ